jgi:dolichol-phosphate mannosyltransferase
MADIIGFSVISPIYNEMDNIEELHGRLTTVMEKLCMDNGYSNEDFEIILIDDGSTDNSWQMIKETHKKDNRLKGIHFSRNFGHHAAVLAGLNYSKGDYNILMDGDLQDQPEEIPKLINKMKDGYDIVQGVTTWRHQNPLQNIISKIFHKFFVKISNISPMTKLGLFRCLSRDVVEAMKELPERTIFLGGLVSWVGFRTAHISVQRAQRHAGKTKYNFLRRLALAMNAITSFSERPLVLIFQLGILVFIFSLFMFGFAIFRKLYYGVPIMGWTSLFAAIFFSTGLITLSLSVVGLYISKLFIEVKQRPRYIIKELLD